MATHHQCSNPCAPQPRAKALVTVAARWPLILQTGLHPHVWQGKGQRDGQGLFHRWAFLSARCRQTHMGLSLTVALGG